MGTYPSSCSGAVDSNYTITYVNGSVQVNTAPLSIAASSDSMTYGGTAPTITPLYSGFVNGDTAASLTTAPTCSTTATSSSPVGSYPTSCSGAVDSNYTITYAPGAVVVGSAGLVGQRLVGLDDLRRIGARYHPVVLGLRERRHRRFAHHGTDVLDHGHVVQPGGELPELVLGRGRLELHHHLRERVGPGQHGAALHRGLVGLDDLRRDSADHHGVVLGLRERRHGRFAHHGAHCSTAATSSSPVGSYPSSCSGAADPNYTITYVNGSVHVNAAPLSIAASSDSMTYGGTAPTITASYSGFVNGDTPARSPRRRRARPRPPRRARWAAT